MGQAGAEMERFWKRVVALQGEMRELTDVRMVAVIDGEDDCTASGEGVVICSGHVMIGKLTSQSETLTGEQQAEGYRTKHSSLVTEETDSMS
jgi:hypothetical protein